MSAVPQSGSEKRGRQLRVIAIAATLVFPLDSPLLRGVKGNCGLPLPAAGAGGTQFPQPRHWRAVVKQAREWQMRQGGRAFPFPLARQSRDPARPQAGESTFPHHITTQLCLLDKAGLLFYGFYCLSVIISLLGGDYCG